MKRFTLTELVVTMAVFVILLAVLLRFYGTAYKATSSSSEQSMIFENARIAMDLMTRDVQCAYYKNGVTPFWHHAAVGSSWGEYRNELLAFIAATSLRPNDESTKICKIKYQKYYSTNTTTSNFGWLRRSVTGDKDNDGNTNPKWNFYNNFIVGYTTEDTPGGDTPVAALTANSMAHENYQKVIPYVTELSFTCYDKTGNTISSDPTTSIAADACQSTAFPFAIEIILKLMDKNSWAKWISIGGCDGSGETSQARDFRISKERTFRKMILLGNRGQYY